MTGFTTKKNLLLCGKTKKNRLEISQTVFVNKNIVYPFFWRLKRREADQKAKKAAILTQTTLAPAGVDQA